MRLLPRVGSKIRAQLPSADGNQARDVGYEGEQVLLSRSLRRRSNRANPLRSPLAALGQAHKLEQVRDVQDEAHRKRLAELEQFVSAQSQQIARLQDQRYALANSQGGHRSISLAPSTSFGLISSIQNSSSLSGQKLRGESSDGSITFDWNSAGRSASRRLKGRDRLNHSLSEEEGSGSVRSASSKGASRPVVEWLTRLEMESYATELYDHLNIKPNKRFPARYLNSDELARCSSEPGFTSTDTKDMPASKGIGSSNFIFSDDGDRLYPTKARWQPISKALSRALLSISPPGVKFEDMEDRAPEIWKFGLDMRATAIPTVRRCIGGEIIAIRLWRNAWTVSKDKRARTWTEAIDRRSNSRVELQSQCAMASATDASLHNYLSCPVTPGGQSSPTASLPARVPMLLPPAESNAKGRTGGALALHTMAKARGKTPTSVANLARSSSAAPLARPTPIAQQNVAPTPTPGPVTDPARNRPVLVASSRASATNNPGRLGPRSFGNTTSSAQRGGSGLGLPPREWAGGPGAGGMDSGVVAITAPVNIGRGRLGSSFMPEGLQHEVVHPSFPTQPAVPFVSTMGDPFRGGLPAQGWGGEELDMMGQATEEEDNRGGPGPQSMLGRRGW